MPLSPALADKVLLVGMMGSGKTTVGRLLAERLGWPHLDSDEIIEATTGRTVPEILRTDGEAAFRAEETKALAQAVTAEGPAVISVAGGAVLAAENRTRLRSAGPVVWLRAEVATLAGRVGDGSSRPLLEGDPEGALRRLYAERLPLYAEVADVIVDVDNLAAGDVVDRIVGALP
jgi:shikimate kinase